MLDELFIKFYQKLNQLRRIYILSAIIMLVASIFLSIPQIGMAVEGSSSIQESWPFLVVIFFLLTFSVSFLYYHAWIWPKIYPDFKTLKQYKKYKEKETGLKAIRLRKTTTSLPISEINSAQRNFKQFDIDLIFADQKELTLSPFSTLELEDVQNFLMGLNKKYPKIKILQLQ